MENSITVVCTLLDKLNIPYKLIRHKAVFTIEEADKLDCLHEGYECKNLFLKTRNKSNYYIVMMSKDKRADLKSIKNQIHSSSLSFASEEELYDKLNLTKGSVTPLGIINNLAHDVILLIDKDITSKEQIGIHPNVNTATIWISFNDLMKVINHFGNKIEIVDI